MAESSAAPETAAGVEHMKWWGWGREQVSFEHSDKPGFAPFVHTAIGLDLDHASGPGANFENPDFEKPDFDALGVPASALPGPLRTGLEQAVGAEYVRTDAMDRVVHTYGKSLRDLLRLRSGEPGRLPDAVLYPGTEAEVTQILRLALAQDAVLIPFGGGTNISGSLEAPRDEQRAVLSVDLGRMNRVLEIDEPAGLARIQAGALGPDLEEQLGRQGWTLGHFPDSFTHSTLGGWIATRSSGMQSDKYGDIADITRAVRVVTPTGTLVTRAVPSTSTGPSVREMILGSEGRLGIITEATVQVHRIPQERRILGYLFPDWQRGLAAMAAIAASDAAPSVTRISDANETAFSFATRRAGSVVDRASSAGLKALLQRKGWNLQHMCLSFIGYEGSTDHVKTQRALVKAIVKEHGGLCIGSGPGALYDQKKFDTPYIRDFLLDRGALADVSETSARWSALLPLYQRVVARAGKAFADIGVAGWIMCHLSHSYHSGACLYFTFAFVPNAAAEPIAQYDTVKSAVQQAFLDAEGTLSHHHAVGTEHSRWLAEDISGPGVAMIRALVDGIDPGRNLNPGKILGEN